MNTDWPVVPLWSVATEIRRAIEPSEFTNDFFHYSIPVVDETGTGRVESAADVGSAKLLLDGGEVLISKLNPRKGRVLIAQQHGLPVVASPEFIALRPNGAIVDRFLAYLLSSETTRRYLDANVQSVTRSHQRVTPELVRHYQFRLPPVDKQKHIADFLDVETARIDQLRALQTAVLEKLHRRDRAVRDSLVDVLIDQVGELPLRRFASKIEQGSSPLCENHPRESDRWGVLKLSAVKNGRFYPEENKQLPEDVEPAREYEVCDGDLLVSRANTPELVGDIAVVRDAGSRLLLPDLIYRVRLSRQLEANFAAQVFLSTRVRSLIQATARGSSQSMVKLRGEDIREWPVPRATVQQQRSLVSAVMDQLNSSARLRATVQRQLALLAERRQGLITQAVTGGISL
jgi:type I restriction enzyme S subunit